MSNTRKDDNWEKYLRSQNTPLARPPSEPELTNLLKEFHMYCREPYTGSMGRFLLVHDTAHEGPHGTYH